LTELNSIKSPERISAIVFAKPNSRLQIQNEMCERQVEVPRKDERMVAEMNSKFNPRLNFEGHSS
jgi:hypothetical protein